MVRIRATDSGYSDQSLINVVTNVKDSCLGERWNWSQFLTSAKLCIGFSFAELDEVVVTVVLTTLERVTPLFPIETISKVVWVTYGCNTEMLSMCH